MVELVAFETTRCGNLCKGDRLTTLTYRVTRADLIRYAGASGDFNPIHWSDRAARSVGLPGVIAHGMYTMALAGAAVARWASNGEVVEFGVKFANPVPVPDDDAGTEVTFGGTVRDLVDDVATLDVTATVGGEKVLAQARARVRIR